jgi:hypothetical protein
MKFSDYALTHRALVCTRMDMFRELDNVNILSSSGPLVPRLDLDLETASEQQAQRVIEFLFPVFLHNIIRDRNFPLRNKLEIALEQMEQTIQENAQNAMIQELLICGLRGDVCDPSGLPDNIDAKRAVALFLAREEWDTMYKTFSLKVVKSLVRDRKEVAGWIRSQHELAPAHC